MLDAIELARMEKASHLNRQNRTEVVRMGLTGLIALGLSCFNPHFADGAIECAIDGSCPPSMFCHSDDRCYSMRQTGDSLGTSPGRPLTLRATGVAPFQINTDWARPLNEEASLVYEVFRDDVLVGETEKTRFFDADSSLAPSSVHQYEVRSVTLDQRRSAFTGPVSASTLAPAEATYEIRRASRTMNLDANGDLTDFAGADVAHLFLPSQPAPIRVRSLWDDQAWWLAFEVADADLVAEATVHDSAVYLDDSVEWMVDTEGDGGSPTVPPEQPRMNSDDFHGIVNLLNAHYDAQGTAGAQQPDAGIWCDPTTWRSAVFVDGTIETRGTPMTSGDNGYRIQIRVPWSTLGVTPTAGFVFRGSFALNDADHSGLTAIMWPDFSETLGTNVAFQNSAYWQRLELVNDP